MSYVATWKQVLQTKLSIKCEEHAADVSLDGSGNLREARVAEVE